MKIKILKTCRFYFEPWKPYVDFHKDVIYDIDDNRAERLIETGKAVKFEEGEITEKMQQPDENKAVDLTKVANKSLHENHIVNKFIRKRGRPPKAR